MASIPAEDATKAILAAAQAAKVGEVIRLSRRACGLTQHQLSEQCKVSLVNRREFLGVAATAVATSVMPQDSEQLIAIRTITAAHRLLDGDTPSRDLSEATTAHLRMATRKHAAARDPAVQQMLATTISEIAGPRIRPHILRNCDQGRRGHG